MKAKPAGVSSAPFCGDRDGVYHLDPFGESKEIQRVASAIEELLRVRAVATEREAADARVNETAPGNLDRSAFEGR